MRLRLVSYNIHKGIGGLDRRYDLGRTAAVLEHYAPDVACLQEVDFQARRSKGDAQVDVLADALGLRHRVWFPNVRVRGGGAYGNAVLSRFPIQEASNIDLTVPLKKRRSVLHARLRVSLPARRGHDEHPTRTLHVYNMHLGLSGLERNAQLRRFLASEPFAGLHKRTPVLVCGDLNDVWGTLGPKHFLPAGFVGPGRPLWTFPAVAPVRALDGVFVRGDARLREVQRGRTKLAKRASDHLPLIAEVELG